METKTTKFDNIIDPKESKELLDTFKENLETYASKGIQDNVAFEIKNPKIIAMWRKHIKPYSDKIVPLGDELIPMEEELKKLEDEYLAKRKECEEKKEEIENIVLQRNKYINRISPLIIREFKPALDEFQEFTAIDEHDGKVYVFIKNWLASYISGFRKKSEAHNKQTIDKIVNPKISN